jgi:zinc protease
MGLVLEKVSQMVRKRRILPALALAVAAVLPASAETANEAKAPDITSFTLANGLEIVVIPDRRAPVVTHMIWYKVGSADEQPGKSGIAHFFEHLMFKETKNYPSGAFSKAVSDIGGEDNAFTSYDYTAYFQKVSPDALKTMMTMEADRMVNLVLNEEAVATEREVIREERRERIDGDPGSILAEEVQATIYQNHPYRLPVIGWMHEIEKLNLQDVTDFYRRFYAPNNAVVVVAGDVDASAVKRMAEETYGKVARGPDLPPRVRPSEPPQETARTVSISDPRITQPSFRKIWLAPSYNTDEPGEAEALDLLGEILGGGIRSRIYQSLVVKNPIAASAGGYYDGGPLDTGSFSVYGTPRDGTTLTALEKAIDNEVRKIVDEGVTSDELEKAKNRFLKSVIFSRDSQSTMAQIYGASLTTGGTIEEIEEWPDRIRAVKPETVKAVAEKYLKANNTVTAYMLPPGGTTQ